MTTHRAFKRSTPIPFLLLLVLTVACGDGSSPPSNPAAPDPVREARAGPNLLLITMDTTRADALGTYGQPLATSPNVDRLAASGVVFEEVATVHPETLPSHSTIFTGKWPFAHGVRANAGYVLSDRNVTLAEVLRDAGYRTGAEIAAPVLRKETQVTQGFDHYRGAESPDVELKVVKYTKGKVREDTKHQRIGSDVANRGIEFIREHRGEKFFLWLHFFDAHNPYSAPGQFNRKLPGTPYHAEVASADAQIGRVIVELDRLGLRGQTLIVLTADHGEGLGEHGEPSHSYFLYETTMHVPLILSGLDLPASIRFPSLVRTVDVAPTVLDLLELPPLEDAQGVSLTPILRGQAADLELTSYSEATRFKATFGIPTIRAIRDGRWKYIHKVNPQLFDLQADPSELNDLAAEHPEIASAMRAKLESLLAEAPAAPNDAEAEVDAHTAAQLMALGYVAKSPAFAISDEVADLALHGSDPVTLLEDIQTVSSLGGLRQLGEFERLLEKLEPLRKRNPNSTFVLEVYADALAALGRHEEAIAVYRSILQREPDNRAISYSLASSLQGAGQGDEAADLMNDLLVGDPCDERVRIEQNLLLQSLGRYAELVGVLEDGAERCPDMLANLNNFAWALATLPEDHLRDGPRALEMIRSVIERAPDPNPAHLDTLGAALAETGDFEAAARAAAKVIEQLEAARFSEDVITQVQGHLEAYRARTPVRDPSPASS